MGRSDESSVIESLQTQSILRKRARAIPSLASGMPPTAVTSPKKPILEPATAGLILAVDWLFFGAEAVTLGWSVLLTSVSAFAITAAGVFWIQRTRSGDSVARAALKALFAGAVAGIPTSIGGTALGTLVLILAGLRGRRSA
jgi:hypothetical protein